MSGLFSDNTLEQIRAASDIVDVIGSYLPLKRAGANFVALCPFHREKTPSFNVNPHRQIFHCFGCHKGGDVFTFVKEFESIDFPEAVRRLAERAKIPIEEQRGPADSKARFLKENLLKIHEQIAQRWQNALATEASGQLAREYLARRGVPDEAIKLFKLGAAPDLWDDTVNWATSKGYDLSLMEKAGLVIRKEGTDRYYDRFRGRLMFPICDEQGRVIGFSGRILSGDDKTAKYVNSPETPIFTKSKVFFGLDKSKRAILEADSAIICEGQLDLIRCFISGVENIVAPQGTAFTADHARILQRYAREVVLCFDSDTAGQNAAVRALDHLLESELAIRVAVVPAPHDPDSFIKAEGGPAFKQLIDRAEGFFDYYLNRLCATNDVTTDRGRLAVLHDMSEAVHKTRNDVVIDKYAQKTALRLGVTPDAVRAQFRKLALAAKPAYAEPEQIDENPEPVQLPSPQEFWLLKLLFIHEDLAQWAVNHLDPRWIQHPMAAGILSRCLALHRDNAWTNLPAFLDKCESPEMQNLITQATAEEREIPNPAQQLADIALRLRNQFIDRQIAMLGQRVHEPQGTDAERVDMLRQQHELRTLKRQPLQPLTTAPQ